MQATEQHARHAQLASMQQIRRLARACIARQAHTATRKVLPRVRHAQLASMQHIRGLARARIARQAHTVTYFGANCETLEVKFIPLNPTDSNTV